MPGIARKITENTDTGSHPAITMSLDILLARWADAHGERIALRNTKDGTSITFADANAIVDRISLYFIGLGLGSGDTVALQLSNTFKTPLFILGLQRAGLVPALLPMIWRAQEIGPALDQIKPIALLSVDQANGFEHAYMMREAAADQLSVRFVFALGDNLPDGVMALDALFDSGGDNANGAPGALPNSDPHSIGLINWASGPDGEPYPVPRSHSELMSAGLLCVLECGLTTTDIFLNAYPLSSITGISAMLAPWLISGGELLAQEDFTVKAFIELVHKYEVTYSALPVSLLPAIFSNAESRNAIKSLKILGCVRPFTMSIEENCSEEPPPKIIDMHNIGNLALIPLMQDLNGISLPLPPDSAPPNSIDMETNNLIEFATQDSALLSNGTKTLQLRGAAIPKVATLPEHDLTLPVRARANGDFIDSGFSYDLPTASNQDPFEGQFSERLPARFVQFGGQLVNLDMLEAVYRSYPLFSDVIAIARPDRYLGNIIVAVAVPQSGEVPGLIHFVEFLTQQNLAPHKLPRDLILVDEMPGGYQGKFELETTVEIVNREM